MGVHGTIRHTVRHRIHHPVLRFAIRLLPGSRIRANLRAERTAGTFWTFLACQREDSSTRWKNWMLIEEYDNARDFAQIG
jgi:predicted component of type VI protein secretion system